MVAIDQTKMWKAEGPTRLEYRARMKGTDGGHLCWCGAAPKGPKHGGSNGVKWEEARCGECGSREAEW